MRPRQDEKPSPAGGPTRIAIENATPIALQEQDSAANVRSQSESLGKQLDAERAELQVLQARLADAHEHSSALVETLAAARNAVDDSNKCPVCDRDFGEIGHLGLLVHIDAKLAELTSHGQQLVDLRNERDQLSAQVLRREAERAHDRQVIIAVHERELFEYLALELSPAYNGDELITIELGERAMEEDGGVIRHGWTSDAAIAN